MRPAFRGRPARSKDDVRLQLTGVPIGRPSLFTQLRFVMFSPAFAFTLGGSAPDPSHPPPPSSFRRDDELVCQNLRGPDAEEDLNKARWGGAAILNLTDLLTDWGNWTRLTSSWRVRGTYLRHAQVI